MQRRPPCIPDAVVIKKQKMDTDVVKKLEKDLEQELGDDYILDLKKNYDLPEEERYDVIPELWEGHNIADYIDPDISKKLRELEREEEQREEDGWYDIEPSDDDAEMDEIRALAKQIRKKKKLMKNEAKMVKSSNKPKLPRTAKKVIEFVNCNYGD